MNHQQDQDERDQHKEEFVAASAYLFVFTSSSFPLAGECLEHAQAIDEEAQDHDRQQRDQRRRATSPVVEPEHRSEQSSYPLMKPRQLSHRGAAATPSAYRAHKWVIAFRN